MNEINKINETAAKKTEGSGEGDGKKDKKAKLSKKGTKSLAEENGNGVAGYLKDISKINQDIENIKSRGIKNVSLIRGNLLLSNEHPK
jgi:hypothetical protein